MHVRLVLVGALLMSVAVSGAAGCDRDGGPAGEQKPGAETTAEPATDVPPAIARVIERRSAAFRGCYEQTLKRSPGLVAIFSMRFTVGEDGRARDVEIIDASFEHEALAHCLTSAFGRLRFPPPGEAGPSTFIYPFRFEPPS